MSTDARPAPADHPRRCDARPKPQGPPRAIWPFSSISTVASVMRHRPARGRRRSAAHGCGCAAPTILIRLWTKERIIACPDSSRNPSCRFAPADFGFLPSRTTLDDSFPRRGLIFTKSTSVGHCHITSDNGSRLINAPEEPSGMFSLQGISRRFGRWWRCRNSRSSLTGSFMRHHRLLRRRKVDAAAPDQSPDRPSDGRISLTEPM